MIYILSAIAVLNFFAAYRDKIVLRKINSVFQSSNYWLALMLTVEIMIIYYFQ